MNQTLFQQGKWIIFVRKLIVGFVFALLSSMLLSFWDLGTLNLKSMWNDFTFIAIVFFLGYGLPITLLAEYILHKLNTFRLPLSLSIYLLVFWFIWLISYQSEKVLFTMVAVGALIAWVLDEWLHHLEQKKVFRTPKFLNYRWLKVIIFLPIMLLSILVSFFVNFIMFLELITSEQLIKEIPSPNGAYTIQIYESREDPHYFSYVDVVFNDEIRDSRRIYWQRYSDDQDLNVVWVGTDTVEVNGKKLNIYKDTFKESKQLEGSEYRPGPLFYPGFHYSGQSPHWNIALYPDGGNDYKNIKLEYRGTDPATIQDVQVDFKPKCCAPVSSVVTIPPYGVALYEKGPSNQIDQANEQIIMEIRWKGKLEKVHLNRVN